MVENEEKNLDSSEESEKDNAQYYVGKRKVKSFSTNEAINLVGVLYTDDSIDEFTQRQWDSVKSVTPYDDQTVSALKWKPLVEIILIEMLRDKARILDKDFILNQVDSSLVENYNLAISKIFGVHDPRQISLPQLDEILKK
jgi:hypothetical protein